MVYYIGKTQEMGQYPEHAFLNGDCGDIRLKGPLTPKMRSAILMNKTHQFNLGYPVEADNVPTSWRWESAKPIPDYYNPEAFPCISPRLRKLIERFEPETHQFFPLNVVNKEGEQVATHFLWVVCNLIDSVNREHTNLEFRNATRWRSDGIKNPRLVFSKARIAGRHFWRDPHLTASSNFLCSDEAGRAIVDAELTAISLRHVETI